MASVELTTEQVIDLVRQLPADRKREILLALAADAQNGREGRLSLAEEQLRRVASQRGLDWNAMSEEERERLADDLVHEDRSCRQ